MENKKTFLQEQYEKNTDNVKIEIIVKDFEELNDYLRFFKRKLKKRDIFDIKTQIDISYKDTRCRF